VWVLQRDRPARLVRLPLSSSEIAEDVRQIGAEYQRGFEISEKIVERLYKGLLEPALRGVAPGTRLIVVPDGSLYSLPFETLGWRSATGWRYVADSWIVSYYPSATLFALSRLNRSSAGRSTPARWERPLFAVGDPLYREDGEFKKLEGTRAEIVAIARALGVETASADLKLGADARETVVKQLSGSGALASYRYIHFAAHGLLTAADTPDGQPALVLSQVSDAGEDGYLTMSEVLGLRFAADLIVLSACQSALGDSVPGEGIVGLMRAFFHAGTQSAVVSLWRVDDKSTAELMRYLYEGLAHNSAACGESDKACALNEARKRLRATNPHPYYWAPFVYFGEP
jgi:CHAT domain-containing protein